MSTRQTNTGKENATVNTTTVWDRIIALETGVSGSNNSKLKHSFANKPNGNITTLDSGQVIGIYDNPRNTSGLAISSGKMVHGTPTGSNCAGYLEAKMDNKITRIGAKFSFPVSTNSGSVALASFEKSLVDEVVNNGRAIPSAGLHVTIESTGVGVIIYKQVSPINLGSISFNPPLLANTEYTLDIFVDGETLYIVLPDGKISQGFTHPEIKTLSSNYATFELYEFDTSKIPANIISVWANDEVFSKNGDELKMVELVKGISKVAPNTYLTIDSNGSSQVLTDLNTATKTGFYQCNTSTANAPTTSSYHVFVESANSQYLIQYAWQVADPSKKYKRSLLTGVWGSWVQAYETVAEINSFFPIDSNGNGLVVTDLNNANKSGYYQCATSATNAPTTDAYHIHVVSSNSQYKLQYAWRLTTGARYKRLMSAGVWGSWSAITE